MNCRRALLLLAVLGLAGFRLGAAPPPLLARALDRWAANHDEVAFTQETRFFAKDGSVKEERTERFDPSLPDDRRWHLIEVNGQAASPTLRVKVEGRKNGRPKPKVDEKPSDFLDLDHAAAVSETPALVRYQIPLRPEAQRLINVDDIEVVVTVDKASGSIVGIGAALKEPIRVLLGIARITDLDVDFRLAPVAEGATQPSEVEAGSTARVKISRFGHAVEYNWSDFKNVVPYAAQ